MGKEGPLEYKKCHQKQGLIMTQSTLQATLLAQGLGSCELDSASWHSHFDLDFIRPRGPSKARQCQGVRAQRG
jgi:hypothetical protein